MAQRDTNGNCFICGLTAAKTPMKNHLIKDHQGGDEQCVLIKAEGAYDKKHWLFFTCPVDATLSAVDKFLRDIWCECCGHLSEFRIGGRKAGKSRKLSELEAGTTLLYEYDFGSTTEIIITIMCDMSREKQREKVSLLARNEPLVIKCERCEDTAVSFDAFECEFVCESCAENSDEDGLLPVVNSPRVGECGYEGELDRWTFDPAKPFPQRCSG